MKARGAFRNEPGLKAEAIRDAADALHPGWTNVASDTDREACAEKFGLSANFVALLSIASNAPYFEGSKQFLVDCLTALPIGCDSLSVARSWAVGRWTDGEFRVDRRLEETSAFAPADAIFRAAGEIASQPVGRQEWRGMRSALDAAEGLSPPARAYAEVAGALAWDEALAPGVHADVWKAWQEAIRIENDHASGWSQEVLNDVLEAMRDAAVAAHAAVSPCFGGEISTPEAAQAHQAESRRIVADSPLGAVSASAMGHFRDSVTPMVAHARAVGLSSILSACGG